MAHIITNLSIFLSMNRIFFSSIVILLSLFSVQGVFANGNAAGRGMVSETETETGQTISQEEMIVQEKEREKTINNINTFLIESYKIKIDKIFSNLSISLERATQNDPALQIQFLKKMQGDIGTKMSALDSHDISVNRKKILGAVFSYIQKNINDSINNLAKK